MRKCILSTKYYFNDVTTREFVVVELCAIVTNNCLAHVGAALAELGGGTVAYRRFLDSVFSLCHTPLGADTYTVTKRLA